MTVSQSAKNLVKSALPPAVKNGIKTIWNLIGHESYPPIPFDNTYPWLNYAFLELMQDSRCAQRPWHTWGVLQGAALAKVLKIPRISVIEFGVAGGTGLLNLEAVAETVKGKTDIEIDVLGFDTGVGLPKPEDIRDQPNMWFEGQLPMNRAALESALKSAKLLIGPVRDTVPSFIAKNPAPVAFVSFDLDLYSSTRDALAIFQANHTHLLPRVACYFDDILGHTYNDFCGERLAITEFNNNNDSSKICPIHGLRYFIPRVEFHNFWPDCMYFGHFFEHPMYSVLDSINKGVFADVHGRVMRRPPESDWTSEIRE
jgi:hypothetical protein